MKELMTSVTNTINHKTYFVSTVKCRRLETLHQAAIFRKIFGPFANFWRPKAFFLGSDAAYLHDRVTTLVRDVDPAEWDAEDVFISAEADEADAAYDAMIANLRG